MIGESLAKGLFTAIYPAGLQSASPFYDLAATAYYPLDPEVARAHLARAGLVDTDGNGFVNFPEGVAGGGDVEVTLMSETEIVTNANIAEVVVALLKEVGLKVTPNFMGSNDVDAAQQAGRWDWYVFRNGSEFIMAVQNTTQLAPVGPQTFRSHRAGPDGTVDLLPFEEELVGIVNAFIETRDPAEQVELMRDYQRVFTENAYSAGLTQFAAVLMINKRFANLPAGVPNFMFNWGEDAIMRERLFVPLDRQGDWKLHPGELPGPPGQAS